MGHRTRYCLSPIAPSPLRISFTSSNQIGVAYNVFANENNRSETLPPIASLFRIAVIEIAAVDLPERICKSREF